MAYAGDAKSFGNEFLDDIIQWIAEHFQPGDIFSNDILREWAEENGYIEE
jgi:hypothetical protein